MIKLLISALIGAGIVLIVRTWEEGKREHRKHLRRLAALRRWSALDKERSRHVLLAIEALKEGKVAEFKWHSRVVSILGPQVTEAWDEYKFSDIEAA